MRRYTIALGVLAALALCAFAGHSLLPRAGEARLKGASTSVTPAEARRSRSSFVAPILAAAGPAAPLETGDVRPPAFAADSVAGLSAEQLGRIEPTLRVLQSVWQDARNRGDQAVLASVDEQLQRLVAATRGVDAPITVLTNDSKNLGGR